MILEATATVIDDLDARLVGLFEQYILRFQVTMYDPMVPLIFQSLEYLNRETSYQSERDPLEVIVLYEFVKIDAKQFE